LPLPAVRLARRAQNFPTKPLRLICPFPPAGAVDIASRATANELSKILGHPVAVENKPGAGGNLGGAEAARSAPDGYTLFMSTSGIQAINPALYAKMPFDPNKDLISVAPLVSLNNVLVLHPSVPAKTRQGSDRAGEEAAGQVDLRLERQRHQHPHVGRDVHADDHTDILHIPYKGSGPAVTDLLGGQVHMMFDNIPSSLPHIKSGKLRALATTGAKRDPRCPTCRRSPRPAFAATSRRVVRPDGAGRHAARHRHEAQCRRGAGHQVARVHQAHDRSRLQHHSRHAGRHGEGDPGRAQALGADREGFRSKGRLK
jgi:tripartite-type tricarboxylate transporter receptor subunit TctC